MKLICGFGDSIMKGIVLESENNKLKEPRYKISENNFSHECENLLDIKIQNYSRFGSTISQAMNYVERYSDRVKESDYIIFEYGGNDCDFNWEEVSQNPTMKHHPKNSISDFRKQYVLLIRRIREMGKKPILLSLPLIDSERYFNHISQGLNKNNILSWLGGNSSFIANWHERYNLEIFKIGMDTRVPVIDITSIFLEKYNYKDYLCEDGIHPNEQGHILIASAIMEYVENKYERVVPWKALVPEYI